MIEAGTNVSTNAVPARDGAGPKPASVLPGLALAGGIALAAMALQYASGVSSLSPLIVAVVVGMAVASTFGVPVAAKPGLALAVRPVLRFAIVLLGIKLTFAQVASIGLGGVAVVVTTVCATFAVTLLLGRLLSVESATARMIAAGTSICGASAVIATGATTGGRGDQVATAVACVTLFGTVAMLTYPLLAGPLGLDQHAYGVWAGASVHEVGQAVAAGFGGGVEAGETATVTKLARVLMLLPVLLVVGQMVRRDAPVGGKRPPAVPGFVLGFAAMVCLNSAVDLPPVLVDVLATASTLLMATALAAVGLTTDLRALVRSGARPLALGFLSFLFVATFGMMLVKTLL